MAVVSDPYVVGREEELARLAEFAAAVSEGPRAMVIRGEAGIGKTTLLRAAVDAAEARGVAVLSARCVEAELPLALVGLSDLLHEPFGELAPELAEHERAALGVALGLHVPEGRPADAVALPRAALALLRRLARDTPVLVAIDDVQWLDSASVRALAFAARRLGGAPLGIVVTQRGEGADPLDLAREFGPRRFVELRVGPLSRGAVSHLLRGRAPTRLSRLALGRVYEASGGNPMFALEFARTLSGEGLSLAPLPFPASLDELVRDRIAEHPPDVRRLLALVAASKRPTPALLRAVEPPADALLDAAVEAGDVALREGGVVRFTHPLLASAAYAALAPSERRAVHARLAAAAEDVEERGRHLALAVDERDASVAAAIDEAARSARARGAPDAAAALAKEAIRLTPSADVAEAEERALGVAEYLTDAARHADAARFLDDLLSTGIAGPKRARALLLRVWVEHDIEDNGPMLDEALRHAREDPHVLARVLLTLTTHRMYRHDGEGSEAPAAEALAIAEELEDPGLLAVALATVASRTAATLGRPDDGMLDRALELDERSPPPPRLRTARILVAEARAREGILHAARDLFEAELEAVVREGRAWDRARVLVGLAQVEWRAGRWERAESHLAELRELATDGGDTAGEAFALLGDARIAGARGLVHRARPLLDRARALSETMHWPLLADVSRWERGALELGLGCVGTAWESLRDVPRPPTKQGLYMEGLHAVPDAVEAAVALGLVDEAEAVLRVLDEPARRGHAWASPARSRCRALLMLAHGDAEGAETAAAEAARGFEAAGFPLDHGRALLVAGEALRRAGERRRAAERLDAASGIFLELGAALWAERAETELRRARPRPRSDGGLTNAERRVAALVAEGRTNAEVAAQLFTTVATVEAHLTRIYRKLGLRSRTELARRAAEGVLPLDGDR